MTEALVLVGAYLLGAIPFGYLLVRWRSGQDVRELGSGNIGATNVLRTTGRRAGLVTLLLDIAKGVLAVWLADRYLDHSPLWMSLAAVAVILGHAFPVFLGFHGGKAVASFVGAFLYLTPIPLAAITVLFVAIVWVTRYLSLGSILCAGLFPFAVWLILHPPAPVFLASLFAGIFIIWRHTANIQRLRAGKEHVFSLAGKKK